MAWKLGPIPCKSGPPMAAKTIADLDIQGRRVFIRWNFDVPLTPAGGCPNATRIRESLPTIQHAIERGGRVVLAALLVAQREAEPGVFPHCRWRPVWSSFSTATWCWPMSR